MKQFALLLISAFALSAAPVTVSIIPDPQIVYPGYGLNFVFGEIVNPNPEILLLNKLTGSMAPFIEDFGLLGGTISLGANSTRFPIAFILGPCIPSEMSCPAPGTYSGDIGFEWRIYTNPQGGPSDYISPPVNLTIIVSDVVPEPSTWLMLAAGLLAIVWRSRAARFNPAN